MGIFNNEIVINKDNPFENDKLNREIEANNLTNLFNLVDNQMVLAIDSPWGFAKPQICTGTLGGTCTELPASGNRKDREGDVGRTRVDERERRQRKCWDTEKRWEHVWLYLVVF